MLLAQNVAAFHLLCASEGKIFHVFCSFAQTANLWGVVLLTDVTTDETAPLAGPGRGRNVWMWIGFVLFLCVIALGVAGEVMVRRAGPILKGRMIETLSTRFNAKVELDSLDVSLLKGLEVSGEGLRIYPPDDVYAAGATEPLIALAQFRFHTGLRSLFLKPMQVDVVHVSGLIIHLPPKEQRKPGVSLAKHGKGKIEIVVGEIVIEDSNLVIGTAKPDKDPKHFELKRVSLKNVGSNAPWEYDAVLVNAIPRGDIHASGSFGPWNTEEPSESMVNGQYTFDHAELKTIKGIGGTLSSVGTFGGKLNRIEVDGVTKTPDFSLDTANHPMGLETTFHATVDGTSGDTYLKQVHARLGATTFTCSGEVINMKGHGHQTELDVDVPAGRLQDFLELAVKTKPPVMQSVVGMKVHLQVAPGHESVTKRLQMKGAFTLKRIHFTNPQVQDKVDDLSLRAQGNAKDAKAGAADVNSEMRGTLVAENGRLNFPSLQYSLPGADVALQGTYSMDGNTFEFFGKVRTQAKISQMVASGWKSFLLKAVDPFFAKNGAGAEVPIKISGTEGAPKFGLDFGRKKSEAEEQKEDLKNRQAELTPDGRIARRKPPGLNTGK